MVKFRSLIIGASGVDFIVKKAKMLMKTIVSYTSPPSAAVTLNAFIYRTAQAGDFRPVRGVLGRSGKPEIRPAIVSASTIFVVNDRAGRSLQNYPVHIYRSVPAVFTHRPHSVKSITVLFGIPAEFVQLFKILRVNNSELALCEWN